MTSINLYQDKQETQKAMPMLAANKGFLFALGILGLVLLALAGIKFIVKDTTKKILAVNNQVDAVTGNLKGEAELNNIVDLQTRIDLIKSNLKIENNEIKRLAMTQIMDKVAKNIYQQVVINNYAFAGGNLSVTLKCLNFEDAAKQLLAFKSSPDFKNVKLNNIKRSEGNVEMQISMSIK